MLSIGRGGIKWSDTRPSLLYSRGISPSWPVYWKCVGWMDVGASLRACKRKTHPLMLTFYGETGQTLTVTYRFPTRCVCRIWAPSFLLFTYLYQSGLGKHDSCFTSYYLQWVCMFMIYFHTKFCMPVASIRYPSPRDLKVTEHPVAVTLLLYFLQRVASENFHIFRKSISMQHLRTKEEDKC